MTLCAHAQKLWPGAPAHAAARSWVADPHGPRAQQAEAVPIAIAIDALAGRTVLGGAGEVERSPTGPRAQSWQLGAWQAVQMQPLGQGAASVVQVSAEPAPAPAQWGW